MTLVSSASALLLQAENLIGDARAGRTWRKASKAWQAAFRKSEAAPMATFEIEIEREPEPPKKPARPSRTPSRKRSRR